MNQMFRLLYTWGTSSFFCDPPGGCGTVVTLACPTSQCLARRSAAPVPTLPRRGRARVVSHGALRVEDLPPLLRCARSVGWRVRTAWEGVRTHRRTTVLLPPASRGVLQHTPTPTDEDLPSPVPRVLVRPGHGGWHVLFVACHCDFGSSRGVGLSVAYYPAVLSLCFVALRRRPGRGRRCAPCSTASFARGVRRAPPPPAAAPGQRRRLLVVAVVRSSAPSSLRRGSRDRWRAPCSARGVLHAPPPTAPLRREARREPENAVGVAPSACS